MILHDEHQCTEVLIQIVKVVACNHDRNSLVSSHIGKGGVKGELAMNTLYCLLARISCRIASNGMCPLTPDAKWAGWLTNVLAPSLPIGLCCLALINARSS